MYRYVVIFLLLVLIISTVQETATDPTDEDRIGFRPEKWGPSQWLLLHISALNLPRDFGSACRDFERYLYGLQRVLPCRECRDELALVMKTVPPREFLASGRIGAVAYVHVIHCCITDRLKGVDCQTPFLREEERYLTEYVKTGGVDIPLAMQQLHDDARDRDIFWRIEDAKLRLKKMLADRTADGRPGDLF